MKRVGFQFKVRKDCIEEYKAEHKKVWQEMLDALKKSGWHNYTLFIRPDGLVFGYFETDQNFKTALERMKNTEVNARWQQYMSRFVDENAKPDETFIELEEYFHLD